MVIKGRIVSCYVCEFVDPASLPSPLSPEEFDRKHGLVTNGTRMSVLDWHRFSRPDSDHVRPALFDPFLRGLSREDLPWIIENSERMD
jgi:hypothetical protein